MKNSLTIKTTKGLFTIRPYKPGDEARILPSWQAAFGKEMPLAHWRWKYIENPAGFRCMLCVAEDGTVVVHYAAQVMRINFQNKTILGLHLTDSFSHPKFRWALGGKSGLFVKTGWVFLKTYLEKISVPQDLSLATTLPKAQFHYGFPGERHFRLGIKLLTYRLHRPGVLYLRRKASPSKRITGLFKNRLEMIALKEIFHWEPLDSFWQKIYRQLNPFCILRDSSFLKWRFAKKPESNYFLFFLKTFWRKKIKAWIILNIDKKNHLLRILDCLAENQIDLTEVLQRIAIEFKEYDMEVWLAGNHYLTQAFLDAGFLSEKEPLGIYPCTRCDMENVDPDKADLFLWTMGDADLF